MTHTDDSEPTGNIERIAARAEEQRLNLQQAQARAQERVFLRNFMERTDRNLHGAYVDVPVPFNVGDSVLEDFNTYLEKTQLREPGHAFITMRPPHPTSRSSVARISLEDLLKLTIYFSSYHTLTDTPIDPDMRDVFASMIESLQKNAARVPMDIRATKGDDAVFYDAAYNLLERKGSTTEEFVGENRIDMRTKAHDFHVLMNFADYQAIQSYRYHELDEVPLKKIMAALDLVERFDVEAFKRGERPIGDIEFSARDSSERNVPEPKRTHVELISNDQNDDEGPNRGGGGGKPSRAA